MINKRKVKKGSKIKIKKKQKILILLFLCLLLLVVIRIVTSAFENSNRIVESDVLSKDKFIEIKGKIELKIANILLDGSVTDESSLEEKVEYINEILQDNKWEKLGLEGIENLNGTWSLDETGKLKFKFNSNEPNFVQDEDIKSYVLN